MTFNQSSSEMDIQKIVSSGETISYLQNIGKTMVNDLKDFNAVMNSYLASMNEKIASDFRTMMQLSSEYKGQVDAMGSDNNERNRKLEILKMLREKLFTSSAQLKN